MSEHSPGPWRIGRWREGTEGAGVYAPRMRFDGEPCEGRLCILTDGDSVDARLIAAAPELLEILDYILDHSARMPTRTDDWWRETEARADALIHRIRGTSP